MDASYTNLSFLLRCMILGTVFLEMIIGDYNPPYNKLDSYIILAGLEV